MSKPNLPLDAYDIKARLIPSALCTLPVLVAYHYVLQNHFAGLLKDLGGAHFIGYLTLEAAATYLVMQLNNRLGGKLLQDLLFDRGRNMPTTQLLMPSDAGLSSATKKDIVTKFEQKFGKKLPLFDKKLNDTERRQRITELTAYIRNDLRGDMLVKNHNIEYGFVRNLCGGAVVALAASLVNLALFGLIAWSKPAIVASGVLFFVYGTVAVLSKWLIPYFGRNYAKVLFEQFLTSK